MPSRKPWLRLYTALRTDPRIRGLTDLEFRAFVNLLCLARENSHGGHIQLSPGVPLPPKALADAIQVNIRSLNKIMGSLVKQGVGGLSRTDDGCFILAKWEDNQPEDPTAATRMSRYRAHKEKAYYNRNTHRNTPVTVTEESRVEVRVDTPIVPLILPEEWNENVKEGAKILLSMPAFLVLAQKDRAWFIDGFSRFRERLGDRDAKEVRAELWKFSEYWAARAMEGKPMKKPWAALTNWFFKVKPL